MARLGHTGFEFKTRYLNYTDKGKPTVALTIGSGSYIVSANYENIEYRNHVLIGKYTSIAHEIIFDVALNHNYKAASTYPFQYPDMLKQLGNDYVENLKDAKFPKKFPAKNPHQVIIGSDVWIGRGVMIMGGVTIGSGAVIGAGAVVAKNIPPYAIAVGNPARVIKYRFDEETIKKFMAVKWWNWDLKKIYANLPIMGDVEKFLVEHYREGMERPSYAQIPDGGGAAGGVLGGGQRNLFLRRRFSRRPTALEKNC